MTDEQPDSDLDNVADNPAGRVLDFLARYQKRVHHHSPDVPAMSVIAEVLGVEPESASVYHQMAGLRMQAESIPDLMEQYLTYPGYRSFLKHYPQILDATKRLSATVGKCGDILFAVNDGGWSALEFAEDALRGRLAEKRLSAAQQRQYLNDLRALIDEILADATLPLEERHRIIGLLRQVEDALVQMRLFGADRIEDAVASVVGVVQTNPKLRDRIAKSKWAQRFIGALGGLLLALAQDAGHLALERAFETEDKPQIAAQQDQNGQHADQPTDQPTPR